MTTTPPTEPTLPPGPTPPPAPPMRTVCDVLADLYRDQEPDHDSDRDFAIGSPRHARWVADKLEEWRHKDHATKARVELLRGGVEMCNHSSIEALRLEKLLKDNERIWWPGHPDRAEVEKQLANHRATINSTASNVIELRKIEETAARAMGRPWLVESSNIAAARSQSMASKGFPVLNESERVFNSCCDARIRNLKAEIEELEAAKFLPIEPLK